MLRLIFFPLPLRERVWVRGKNDSMLSGALCRRCTTAAETQQFTGVVVRLAIVFDGDLTIHQHIAIALSALDPAPFAAWQIVDDFGRADLEIRVVVTDDVRRCTAFEDAAILKPGDHARQCAQAPMRFFQAHHLMLAYRFDDHFGRITTSG